MPARYLGIKMGSALAVLACLVAACSTGEPAPPVVYVPPSMPSLPAAGPGIKAAAADAKLIGQIEISDFRPIDNGPGRFMVCIRGVSNDIRTGTHVVFFNNNDYVGSRLPVILDRCEKQNYRPIP
jgi:hypothetical protein